ncbi:FAD-dependent pyridine nucleotide-disulfide oxidoreductase [Paenibacillus curdlanolyticus YK9]|uniref:NADH:ubiquinone reductase (non-electrogenic) n=1 Tax=Paenibacillus curdlanolyticus YK9 TaxID=717606 RepID=E0I4M2_9BACL|nr:FAD-dependent oxidoreductase [Paenibacillus curdlanolyticus]EFM12553.1 FAD-dependent pyridine nucleotide-disulfide oxidoreductase [Paenibacillus curdlanolyticus YK9]
MKERTCVVWGGGYAGIHAIKAIAQWCHNAEGNERWRLVLIDKSPHHVRKVLLFRPAVETENIAVPWQQILPEHVQYVQGSVRNVDDAHKCLVYQDAEGNDQQLPYEVLVIAAGSSIRLPQQEQGGFTLADAASAARIRTQWLANLKQAAVETHASKRQQLMSAAVVGGGITGIETAAELAYAMKAEAARLGLDAGHVRVHLLNKQQRLFVEGPTKASRKLDRELAACGVTIHHACEAVREAGGQLLLAGGDQLPVGLTIWALGLVPNPVLRSMALPLTNDGQIQVDECYRVHGLSNVYSIGDCAHIVDPASGKADRMTCKEAVPQAQRLGKIIRADQAGHPAPPHKPVMDTFVIGLGPGRGLLWTHKWGLDMIITGKLAYKIKSYVWDYASLLKG